MDLLEDDLAPRLGEPPDPRGQVVDRHGRTRIADVEALANGARVLEAEEDCVGEVVDVAPGANLRPVAVDGKVAPRECRLDEGADRAAADLSRAVDVERADGDGRQ